VRAGKDEELFVLGYVLVTAHETLSQQQVVVIFVFVCVHILGLGEGAINSRQNAILYPPVSAKVI
jgi:hypothetical protein